MPDRENVIKRLMELHGSMETISLIADVIALLREHEPVKPEIHNSTSDVWYYICGECKTPIGPGYCYCSHCGKAVKWDA